MQKEQAPEGTHLARRGPPLGPNMILGAALESLQDDAVHREVEVARIGSGIEARAQVDRGAVLVRAAAHDLLRIDRQRTSGGTGACTTELATTSPQSLPGLLSASPRIAKLVSAGSRCSAATWPGGTPPGETV